MADKIETGSAERVAYELMRYVADKEYEHNKDKYLKPDPRTYYLTLYHQCIKAGHGGRDMREVMETD